MSEDGATAMEYGLIAALLSLGIIVGLTAVSTAVQANLYDAIAALVAA